MKQKSFIVVCLNVIMVMVFVTLPLLGGCYYYGENTSSNLSDSSAEVFSENAYSAETYNEIDKFADGTSCKQRGSMCYLFNKFGERISQGYHEITDIPGRNHYLAKLGSMNYLLNEMGFQVSEGYHEIILVKDGYSTTRGSRSFVLNECGEQMHN